MRACCAWSAALCHGLLAQPLLFSWVIRSSQDLLCFPGQKAKMQDKVQMNLCVLSASLGKGCSGASPFPDILPGSGTACDVPFSKTVWRSLGLVFTLGRHFTSCLKPGKGNCLLHGMGTSRSPLGPTTTRQRQQLRASPVAFCHLERSGAILHPLPGPGFPLLGLTLPVSPVQGCWCCMRCIVKRRRP